MNYCCDRLRAAVHAKTRDMLSAVWQAAPDDVRPEVQVIGEAFTAGELPPMGVTDRLGALLRKRWPAGFDVAARVMPLWAVIARGETCTPPA